MNHLCYKHHFIRMRATFAEDVLSSYIGYIHRQWVFISQKTFVLEIENCEFSSFLLSWNGNTYIQSFIHSHYLCCVALELERWSRRLWEVVQSSASVWSNSNTRRQIALHSFKANSHQSTMGDNWSTRPRLGLDFIHNYTRRHDLQRLKSRPQPGSIRARRFRYSALAKKIAEENWFVLYFFFEKRMPLTKFYLITYVRVFRVF